MIHQIFLTNIILALSVFWWIMEMYGINRFQHNKAAWTYVMAGWLTISWASVPAWLIYLVWTLV